MLQQVVWVGKVDNTFCEYVIHTVTKKHEFQGLFGMLVSHNKQTHAPRVLYT